MDKRPGVSCAGECGRVGGENDFCLHKSVQILCLCHMSFISCDSCKAEWKDAYKEMKDSGEDPQVSVQNQ